MRLSVSREPDECLTCRSDNIRWDKFGDADVIFCNTCGTIMEVKSDPTQIEASLSACPHCTIVGELATQGGEEYCGACGLDPNEGSVASPILAHLFKIGSGIREILEKDSKGVKPGRRLGDFVRKQCGPHCVYEQACPQDVANLVKCDKEEREGQENSEVEMSRRWRHRNNSDQAIARGNGYKLSKKERKKLQRQEELDKKRATLVIAGGGWLSQHMSSITRETINAEDDNTT